MNNQPNNLTQNQSAVFELQQMLRLLSQHSDVTPRLNPDGLYGPETTAAVQSFQQAKGLPVTGNVDFATWQSIRATYQETITYISPGVAIKPFPGNDTIVKSGEKSHLVTIIQIMLSAVSVAYGNNEGLTVTGEYDSATETSVRLFQRAHRLPETGEVMKNTWNELATSYNLFANNSLYTG